MNKSKNSKRPPTRQHIKPQGQTQSKAQGKAPGKAQIRPRPSDQEQHARRPDRSKKPSLRGDGPLQLYGLHTVEAALQNKQRRKTILHATQNALSRLSQDVVAQSGVIIELCESNVLDQMVGSETVHQGVVLICDPLNSIDASELFQLAQSKLLLVLDQITDPHNVGAILRSAVAMGVDAVITTHRNSAQQTAVLAKSASGALDMIDVIEVRNLSKAIDELSNMRFCSIGLDSAGPDELESTIQSSDAERIALVLGSEGKGLRQQTMEACTHLARLDMPGRIKSLNVSNAAALALYVVQKNQSSK